MFGTAAGILDLFHEFRQLLQRHALGGDWWQHGDDDLARLEALLLVVDVQVAREDDRRHGQLRRDGQVEGALLERQHLVTTAARPLRKDPQLQLEHVSRNE